ncbi:hypothetical protein PENFLA_c028G08693 [Penicillium flavigenum]|uniref:Uncharacterized protein n=1 Tax=Penicillium flavigenum TaxID=254877 RepID=A0A1V6SQJ8_9EURO|nr:hypothetical protein PENFLA_c028G08693 [Penicillium flavigenum]
MDDDFNSSDVDFGPPEADKRGHAVGQESIDQIIQNSAPGLVGEAVQYLSATHLREDPTIPFTGEDLIRFFDSIIDIVKPTDTGKPAPNLSLVQGAFEILLAYGEFTWTESDGFNISRHDRHRLQSFLDNAVKAGRLIKGSWRKLSALGCRAGDVALAAGYTGDEYLQHRHIELTIDGHTANFHNIRAAITLESVKGHKDALNENFVRFLRPLDDVDFVPVENPS